MEPIVYDLCFGQMLCHELVVRCVHVHRYRDDGLTVLKTLKANNAYSEIPVIIISAKTTELDRVKGLDLGAEDYLCKPFGVLELVSRVKARLRKLDKKEDYSYCGIELSDSERTVFADGEKVELTYKEFELLKLLIGKPKTVPCGKSLEIKADTLLLSEM